MSKSVVSVRMNAEVLAELDRLAGNRRATRSKVIERILENFVRQGRVTQNAALGSKRHG